jgi:hypothetical protein
MKWSNRIAQASALKASVSNAQLSRISRSYSIFI